MSEVKTIQGSYDMYKDWEQDEGGYFLIKIYPDDNKIGVRHCDNKTGEPTTDIFGKYPQEIYNTAIKRGLVTNLQHAAYLGKELYKAYVALLHHDKYEQDANLIIQSDFNAADHLEIKEDY